MTFPVGHTNGTDPTDHETNYGAGTAFVVVLLGLLLIGMIISAPWFLGEEYYTPISMYPGGKVLVLQGANTPVPVVQGGKAAPAAATPVATAGGTLVTPDLSCLKGV